MPQYINAGDIMTVSVGGATLGNSNSDLSAAALAMINDNLQVLSKQVQVSGFMQSAAQVLGSPLAGTQYLATLQVKANSDFNDDTDVASIIAHEIYVASQGIGGYGGKYPTVAVTHVNGVPTGEAQAAPTPTGESITDFIDNFFSGLQTGGTIGAIILVGIVVLVLFLVAYGPNVGGLAKTAAVL